MILLAGGTGRLGTVVVRRLVDRGIDVRVLTRDAKRAAHLDADRVEVVIGDVRDPKSLVRAVAGVDVVVSAVHGFSGARGESPSGIDRDGNINLIEATKGVGADLVLMSIVGAGPQSPMELFRMKYAAEQHASNRAVRTTVVRATAFLELWVELLRRTAARSGRPVIFGRGDNPINFVSVIDVAALVDMVVTDPLSGGGVLEIGGPENLTFNQLAGVVQDAAGRASAPRHVPPAVLRVMAGTVGRLKPGLGRQMRAALVMDQVDLSFDAVPIHRTYPDLPATSVADLLGRSSSHAAPGLGRGWVSPATGPKNLGSEWQATTR